MTDLTPYAAPKEVSEATLPETRSTSHRMLLGFLLAPAVTPLVITAVLFAITMMLGGFSFSTTALFLLGTLLAMGLGFSYGLTTIVGLPIVLALRRKGKLNAANLIRATLLLTLLAALGMSLLSLPSFSLARLAMLFGIQFLLLCPFTLLSTLVFWWIVCRPEPSVTSQTSDRPVGDPIG